ncbi:unnamed protein product [Closterium sp. NIES-53]
MRSTGDPRLILGKGYRHVGLGGYGRTDPLLNKPFYPNDEAGPLPYCSVPIPMDDENPRESINADTYFDFADTDYVTPAAVNTTEAERIGPNFIPDTEDGDEAAYPEDATLPRYTQSGLQILGLVTAVHGMNTPKEPATVQQALGGGV